MQDRIELKEKELDKVIGGVDLPGNSYNAGDCRIEVNNVGGIGGYNAGPINNVTNNGGSAGAGIPNSANYGGICGSEAGSVGGVCGTNDSRPLENNANYGSLGRSGT